MNEWFETHPFLKQMRRRLSVELAVCLLLFCGVFLAARYAGLASAGADAVLGKKKPVVFLDAGHGDFDPGKVSVDGSLEKDINLAIAKRLKWYLEQSDVEIAITHANIGNLCFALQELDEGLQHMQQAAEIFECQEGKNDPHYASA